jgi:hypothetical protein
MRGLLLMCVVLSSAAPGLCAADTQFRLAIAFSREADRGENWGSLFEITDPTGAPIAGAGYLGAYNTFPRSDRDELHVFVRSLEAKQEWRIERLPPIESTATGFYPFQVGGELYVSPRNGSDPRVHLWDSSSGSWRVVDDVPNGSERIAGKSLHVTTDAVTWDGRTLIKPAAGYRFGEHYFAGEKLVLRAFRSDGVKPENTFVVHTWSPDESLEPQPVQDFTLELPQPREFVYAFAQWHDHTLAITNMGGVYRLRPSGWDVLRVPEPSVSYQIYSALNYRDKLLLGHYPTGEIYEYAGDKLILKKGWPPVMPGVSHNAREAQTLAIYNGELYAGVWPWAEVWRYDGADWHFVQRMFSHPALIDSVTHPYEAETKNVDNVFNLWGQRVTGLVPYKGSLIITTSSKGGAPWDPKFAFLSPDEQRDYGAIYRATLPGQISVHAPVSPIPTRLELTKDGEFLTVRLNGAESGKIRVAPQTWRRLAHGTILWADGIYGPCRLNLDSKTFEIRK